MEIVHQTPSDVGDMKGEQGNKVRKYNMIHFQVNREIYKFCKRFPAPKLDFRYSNKELVAKKPSLIGV